jgi:hypothetical protein
MQDGGRRRELWEQLEVKAQLVKLAPAWGELRKVLNELNRGLKP